MRPLKHLLLVSLLPSLSAQADPIPQPSPLPSPFDQQQQSQQHRISHDDHRKPRPGGISNRLFATLERTARLVDITYCVGTTGISPPFSCVSRCKDFPTLRLVRTWNTGVLLSDSCGYIAIDSGTGAGTGGTNDGDKGAGGENNNSNRPPGEEGQQEIVVAFRGTYSITNTIVDLSTVPQEYVPYPAPPEGGAGGGGKCENCTVHMGFMASWKNARAVVIPALHAAREKYPGYRVHLVGHSLGGAVAALAALELKLGLGWRDVVVTTFGEPKVGNDKLAEYIDGAFGLADGAREDLPYRRVTHAGDPVPLLPLSEWGYASHAGEVYIEKSDLPPGPDDLRLCRGANDPECMGGAETSDWLSRVLGVLGRWKIQEEQVETPALRRGWFPARLKLWQLLFAHRDYFWRLGLCLPGGDPVDWGREKYNLTSREDSDVPEIRDL
ncbi:Alpha/Beta hydrolase protein [Achaetomium macrosporum]|uniref:Alpha/Beta hydrolase protein n=1 Tax=Achaetomium macrosporum TaxID=79813 RepID=A0AAN7CFM2_9PEZI|nr:Alpha/Beta hydrolase protein [Achaetomium macrosporum]